MTSASVTEKEVPVRRYGRHEPVLGLPDLAELQTKSYEDFLQRDIPRTKRRPAGLEALLREVFPIESYDKTMRLEFLGYRQSFSRRHRFARVSQGLERAGSR